MEEFPSFRGVYGSVSDDNRSSIDRGVSSGGVYEDNGNCVRKMFSGGVYRDDGGNILRSVSDGDFGNNSSNVNKDICGGVRGVCGCVRVGVHIGV
ncbi:Hypothetical predicted protein [Octopus vulgaris]|uniref:Uncharacterized protein n=1 Tax=Octopus vulgaris TaxID=6645 RepID=A0AA36AV18_OCTVU|nr:Hypothetical predicted protein [Octopus vulgaris]